MILDRRQFVLGSLAAGAAAAAGPAAAAPARKSILVLGGTGFLGPHVVTAALARGHTVTLFNRGKTHAELFPEVEKLHGDRDGHLEVLASRTWDAVVDPSGYVPRIVKLARGKRLTTTSGGRPAQGLRSTRRPRGTGRGRPTAMRRREPAACRARTAAGSRGRVHTRPWSFPVGSRRCSSWAAGG